MNGRTWRHGWLAWLGVVVLTMLTPASAQLRVRSYALNAFKPELDGQWQGIRLASDGNVYFASSTHSGRHGACVFRYDPQAAALTLLSRDITRECGEDPETNPQGKLHSDFVEANGWLYFASHFSSERPGAAETYTGAHALGLEMATGRFRDFGVIHPGYTCYSGIGADPQRRQLYVHATPITNEQVAAGGAARLYRFDIATGTKKEVARLAPANHAACFWLFVDQDGDVWFTQRGAPGTLFRLRAATDQLDRWENALPAPRRLDRDEPAEATREGEHWWTWAQPVDGRRCVFTTVGDGMLWMLDTSKAPDWPAAFTPVAHIGPNNLGMALGGERVYFIQRAERRIGHKAPADATGHHLLSVAIAPTTGLRAVVDHGLIVDQDGRQPWRIETLATDANGRVFMVGDWHLRPGEAGGTLRYTHRGGQESYRQLRRGQFFAVADTGASAAER